MQFDNPRLFADPTRLTMVLRYIQRLSRTRRSMHGPFGKCLIPDIDRVNLSVRSPVWPAMKAMSLRDSDPPKPPTVGKSQPLQDQEFAERLRIAEISGGATRGRVFLRAKRRPGANVEVLRVNSAVLAGRERRIEITRCSRQTRSTTPTPLRLSPMGCA